MHVNVEFLIWLRSPPTCGATSYSTLKSLTNSFNLILLHLSLTEWDPLAKTLRKKGLKAKRMHRWMGTSKVGAPDEEIGLVGLEERKEVAGEAMEGVAEVMAMLSKKGEMAAMNGES
ncbi:hypothetical protein ACLOJK_037864 [Asimina triloba]